ncbi:hypothetical protein AB1I63_00270 [Streptococcus pneumoniae]
MKKKRKSDWDIILQDLETVSSKQQARLSRKPDFFSKRSNWLWGAALICLCIFLYQASIGDLVEPSKAQRTTDWTLEEVEKLQVRTGSINGTSLKTILKKYGKPTKEEMGVYKTLWYQGSDLANGVEMDFYKIDNQYYLENYDGAVKSSQIKVKEVNLDQRPLPPLSISEKEFEALKISGADRTTYDEVSRKFGLPDSYSIRVSNYATLGKDIHLDVGYRGSEGENEHVRVFLEFTKKEEEEYRLSEKQRVVDN